MAKRNQLTALPFKMLKHSFSTVNINHHYQRC